MENQEAKQDVGSSEPKVVSSPTIEQGNNSASAPVSSGNVAPTQEKTENIPFGDKRHPEYKRFKELTDSNRKYKEQLSTFERELAELRGFKDSMLSQKQQSSVNDEQKQALTQLFQMGLSVPEIKDMIAKQYGLDRLDSLNKDYTSFKDSFTGQQAEAEIQDILKSATEMGLDKDEVEAALEDQLTNNPLFADKSYTKGAIWAAFKDKYWDRMGELQEAKINKKIIEDREKLKNGQTQAPVNVGVASAKLPDKDDARRNIEIIRRAGGVEKLPFFK